MTHGETLREPYSCEDAPALRARQLQRVLELLLMLRTGGQETLRFVTVDFGRHVSEGSNSSSESQWGLVNSIGGALSNSDFDDNTHN